MRPDAIANDRLAIELRRNLDWNFADYDSDWMTQVTVAIRTQILDEATSSFIRRQPQARIVNLGAGFCTRGVRLGSTSLDWIDLDVPALIDLKRQLLPEQPGYRYLARSILDLYWIAEISSAPERPTLFIAEGILQYLPRADVEHLIRELSRRFSGTEMLLEIISPLAASLSILYPTLSRTGLRARWGLSSARELEAWAPGARLTAQWFYDRHLERWGWVRTVAQIPIVRHLMSVVHLRPETAVHRR